MEIIAGERPPGFIQTSMIGDMTLVRSTSQAGRLVSARSDQLIRRSLIDSFLLGLVVKSNFAIRQAGHEGVLSPGELILIDSLRKYELDVSAALNLIVLKIAWKSVETQMLEHGRYLGRTLKTDQGLGFVVKNMLTADIATAPCISTFEASRFEQGLIDMLGSTYRYQTHGESRSVGKQAHKVFNRLCQFIDNRLTDADMAPRMI